MSDPLYAFPPVCAQTLRALARYPSRIAFSWPGGSITYAGATDLIGRIQKVFMQLGLQPGARVALLSANRADSWCSGVAAQLARLSVTSLHPLGSLDDQLFQIEDSETQVLVVDADTFRDRGGELAAKASNLKARVHARSGRLWRRPAGRRRGRRHRHRRAILPGPTISRR